MWLVCGTINLRIGPARSLCCSAPDYSRPIWRPQEIPSDSSIDRLLRPHLLCYNGITLANSSQYSGGREW